MPVARFEMPDGRVARFEVPDGTTPEQAQAMIAQSLEGGQIPSGGRDKFDLRGEGYDRMKNYSPRDTIAGMVRGAGSIGATLMAPFDYAEDKLTNLIAGPQAGPSRNEQRRTDMTGGLQTMGADPTSSQFQANKLLGEVAGTSGIGPAAAAALSRIPGAATQIPSLLNAIRTGGMTTGAPAGASRIADIGVRVAGGAVNGGLTAGAVNPDDAGTGMMIGGAAAPVVKTAGAVGGAIADALRRKPINPVLRQTLQDSLEAGYVVPPNMVNPSLKNQIVESISGKQATQQIASTRNTQVTEKLTRQALGIADDVPLSQGTLENLRKTAGRAYAEVSSLSPQAASDLEALKLARNEAQGWFKAYNRSANPNDLATAKGFRAQADELENWLEYHAAQAGRSELIPQLHKARKEIAKTYTVGRALNDASGTIDAKVLGRMSEKRLPLSDGLDVAGKFASAFPTVAKSPQQVGSPAAHNLKAAMAAAMSAGGGAGGAALGLGALGTGGMGLAMGAIPFIAPPIARAAMFSKGAQRGLLNQGGGMQSLLDDPETLGLLTQAYRSSPLLAGHQ